MQTLTGYAHEHSGVTREESVALDKVNLFERLGTGTITSISEAFYDSVFSDEEWFRSIFSASTKQEAIRNQVDFLVERLGGPKVYTERKGKHHRLIGRHAPYAVTPKAAVRWLKHMEGALYGTPGVDEDSRELLLAYFKHMAHFLVAGKEYANTTNLVDYHNKMSEQT
ncbi:unnamed protein product [Discosporangium mesarthrocarpum]